MSEETLIKYLEFLKTECLRHSNDKLVNENEIQLFKLEVNKFISLFQNSKFESSIKEKVLNIHFIFLFRNIKELTYYHILLMIAGQIVDNLVKITEDSVFPIVNSTFLPKIIALLSSL